MNKSELFRKIKVLAVSAVMSVATLASPLLVDVFKTEAASAVNYAKALQYSLYLYDANMCGSQVGERSQLNWRDDCHTSDSKISTPYGTMDLSGGYHDAGDHVKFGLSAAYSATMLGLAYSEFSSAFKSTGQSDHLKQITNHFAEYFRKCTVMNGSSVKAFCYQVGNGDTDHAQWTKPEKQNISRPAYFATSSNPCTDVVAQTSAALAMNYINFRDPKDLTYAKALYNFAKSNNKANHQAQSYYTGTSYLDDLALASILLYKATNTASYKSDCANWISQSNWAYTSDYPLCWDSVWPAVNVVYANEWDRVAENLNANKNNFNTSEGYACRDNWGSARYNTATQFIGLLYDKHKSTSTYTSWAKSQMEYLFGNNKNNQCYMVGYASNSVKNPHHRAATGFTSFPSENQGKAHANVLVGALVGGPDKSGNYVDKTDEYKYSEVALDYNAAFVGALAGLYNKFGKTQSVASSIPGVSGSTAVVTTAVTKPSIVTSTAVAERNAQNGDANLDGKVNVRDAAYMAAIISVNKASMLPKTADFNGDGKKNVRDAAAIANSLAKG